MDWIVIDNNPDIHIVDDIIANFRETLRNSGVKCKVTVQLAEQCHWTQSKDEVLSLMRNSSTTSGGENADLNQIVVHIEFNMPTAIAEKLPEAKLAITTNLVPWSITPVYKDFPYCCGVYMREGFDDAYKAMHKLKPALTEQTFARNSSSEWDEELVSVELFHGWDNCLATKVEQQSVETGESKVVLSLLGVDLDANITYITTLLSPYV